MERIASKILSFCKSSWGSQSLRGVGVNEGAAETHTASQTTGSLIRGYVRDPSVKGSRLTISQVGYVHEGSSKKPPIRVFNFAFPGATAEDDLCSQFSSFKRSLRVVPPDGERTTYCKLAPKTKITAKLMA